MQQLSKRLTKVNIINRAFIYKNQRIFSNSSNNEEQEVTIKIPSFKQEFREMNQDSTSMKRNNNQSQSRTSRFKDHKQQNNDNQQMHQGLGTTDNYSDKGSSSFEKLVEKKFGKTMLNKLNTESNQRLQKPYHPDLNGIMLNKYNSTDMPVNLYDTKRVLNNMETKKLKFQRYKHSSFENIDNEFGAQYQFYLNRERISTNLDVDANDITPIANDWQDPNMIPNLSNSLDILIKQPGIFPTETINHYAKGKLGNFLTKLPQYSQINEECISPYFPPGQDENLRKKAIQYGCKYLMSTSTVSSVLSHIYYCLSNFKSPHFNNLSEAYDREPLKFMVSQRKPNTVFLTRIDKNRRIYSLDGDSGFIEPSNVVLLKMGKYMEKMLTTDAQYFRDHYILDPRTNKAAKEMSQTEQGKSYEDDYFRYLKAGNMMLRSQIDCRGIDGEGNDVVFELKTRATSVLRYEIYNYIDYLDYEIVKYKGKHSSYEREFYDLVRGGFLKYIMQCKIGQMSGAVIAYHNTQKIFGFEYIPLKTMEKRVFGCPEFSDIIFKSSLTLLEKVLDFILEDQDINEAYKFEQNRQQSNTNQPNKIYKVGFYANESERSLNVLVEVFDDDMFYQERFRNVLPEYMRDPIDYYISHKIHPQVYKYSVGIYPMLNGLFIDQSPILFEKGDTLDVKYSIQRYGKIEFNEYMKFLHEAYKCDSINLDNEYAGTWSFVV